MMNWNYATENEIRQNIEHLALQAVAAIIEGKKPGDEEETTEFIKYERVFGVFALLEEIVDDMLETNAKAAEEKKELADSCKKASEAFDNLFVTKTWKISTGVPDDGTHS